MNFDFGFDIETTGLNPLEHKVTAAALVSSTSSLVFAGPESSVLAQLNGYFKVGKASRVIYTWNGDEFDLPFLAVRFALNSFTTSLRLVPRGDEHGKYGGQLYRATWGDSTFVDMAPRFMDWAAAQHVGWSLKPVARALGLDPIEIDVSNGTGDTDPALLRQYVESDARITLALRDKLDVISGKTVVFP